MSATLSYRIGKLEARRRHHEVEIVERIVTPAKGGRRDTSRPVVIIRRTIGSPNEPATVPQP